MLRTIRNICENNDRFLEAGGNAKTVKDFKSCMFKPMKLTNGKDDTFNGPSIKDILQESMLNKL